MLPSHTSVPSLKMGLSVPVTSCLQIKTTSISYATEKISLSVCFPTGLYFILIYTMYLNYVILSYICI